MSREEMFHELKHHGSRHRPHKQRVAIVLSQERRCGRRNPRNSPYGATQAEFDHIGAPGSSKRLPRYRSYKIKARHGTRTGYRRARVRRIRGGAGDGAILLGHLHELVLLDGSKLGPSQLRGLYLAWLPRTNNFAAVHKVNRQPGRVTREALDRHQKFHGAPARKLATYDWPDRVGQLREIGLLKSLTYVIPPDVDSPEKANTRWYHLFGDHGELGHGPVRGEKKYPTRFMPMMCEDAAGNLSIKRRPGNNYRVTDWIFW